MNYVHLNNLLDDLVRLKASEGARERRETAQRGKVTRVDWFDGESYWLTEPQRRVVSALAEVYAGKCPEVDQRTLIRESGVAAHRLAEVFAGSPAWGALVVEGSRAGYYRLAECRIDEGEAVG
jgi:hypothetical protein